MWHKSVIAKNDRAFCIIPSFVVCEIEDFDAVGYRISEDIAYAVLSSNSELSPTERIIEAFRTVERGADGKQFPIVIMNTKSDERTVVYE